MLKNWITLSYLVIVSFSFGQNAEVFLSIEPKSADVGEVVTITVKSNVEGDVEIDNLPSSFVYGYDVMNGMDQEMDHNTGEVITYYFLSQTGAFGTAGKFNIGPAFVKKGNKVYKSNKVVVNIGDKSSMSSGNITAQQLKNPAFGIIQTNKLTIYEGEPILVGAKVYSHFNPTHLDSYRPFTVKGAIDKHEIGNSNRIIVGQERFRGRDLYTFEYDKNVIFPTGTGVIKISPYTMNLHKGYTSFLLTSNHATVTVKSLPPNPPSDFIGGVGHFEVSRTIEIVDLKQGEVFKMIITITGIGNLQNIIEPKPKLPKGCIVYGDALVEENIMYGSKGAEGEINYQYNIQVNLSGDIILPPTTISFFDLQQEKYVSASTTENLIVVKADKNYVVKEIENNEDGSIKELTGINSLRKSKISTRHDTFFGSPVFWGALGAPVILSFLFLYIARRRENTADESAIKQHIRKKDSELKNAHLDLQSLVDSPDQNLFYSEVESVLMKSIEIKMNLTDDRKASRQEIYNFLALNKTDKLSLRVKNLFSECDQHRYGFDSQNSSKREMLDTLNSLLKEIRS